MIEWLNLTMDQLSINKYFILPYLIALVVFISLIKEKITVNLIELVTRVGTVFSTAVAIEYVLIFLFYDSLPGELHMFEKAVIFLGMIITFMIVFKDVAAGTKVGNWVNNLVRKYALTTVDIEPVPFLNDELLKLYSSQHKIMSTDANQVKEGSMEFIQSANALIVKLQVDTNDENKLQEDCDLCNDKIESLLPLIHYSQHSDEHAKAKNDVMLSTSKFIGKVNGLVNSTISKN